MVCALALPLACGDAVPGAPDSMAWRVTRPPGGT